MIQDFVNEWNEQYLDFDSAYGAQCFDLCNAWAASLGLPTFSGDYAYQIFGQHPEAYDEIPNTPGGVPSPGDIMVWNYHPDDEAGHTAVFLRGDTNGFTSFDQNWPLNSPCHEQPHDYSYIIGWLHPKILGANMPDLTQDVINLRNQLTQTQVQVEQSRLQAVTGFYRSLLGRDPEPGAADGWMRSQLSIDQIYQSIYDSAEAQNVRKQDDKVAATKLAQIKTILGG